MDINLTGKDLVLLEEIRQRYGLRDISLATRMAIRVLGEGNGNLIELRPLDKGDEVSAEMRALILERDEFSCQGCGYQSRDPELYLDLAVHHIIPRRFGGEQFIENLITLCHACHRRWDAAILNRKQAVNYIALLDVDMNEDWGLIEPPRRLGMAHSYKSTKIFEEDLPRLHMIAARTGETNAEVLHRLIEAEAEESVGIVHSPPDAHPMVTRLPTVLPSGAAHGPFSKEQQLGKKGKRTGK